MISKENLIYLTTLLVIVGFIFLAIYYALYRRNVNNPAKAKAPAWCYWVGLVSMLLGLIGVVVTIVQRFKKIKERRFRSRQLNTYLYNL